MSAISALSRQSAVFKLNLSVEQRFSQQNGMTHNGHLQPKNMAQNT